MQDKNYKELHERLDRQDKQLMDLHKRLKRQEKLMRFAAVFMALLLLVWLITVTWLIP